MAKAAAAYSRSNGVEADMTQNATMTGETTFSGMRLVGESFAFREALRRIERIAPYDVPVLIEGETGTGKELAARAVHALGPRRRRAFVPLNCGTLPDALIESELFGHTKGAFTDAREAKGGLVAAAEGGTLFLDEVDSLSSRGQVALLRLLQDNEYRPVGGRTPLRANIRMVAATNAELSSAVVRGCFREDLLFRLRVLTVTMPPLRERDEDVKLLARSFLARFAAQYGRPTPRLTEETEGAISSYAWPGNVRELENRLLSAFLLAEPEAPVRLPGLEPGRRTADTGLFREARARTIAEFERRYLTTLLRRVGGNMSRASREAGKERSSLIRLVRKHGLKRDDFA